MGKAVFLIGILIICGASSNSVASHYIKENGEKYLVKGSQKVVAFESLDTSKYVLEIMPFCTEAGELAPAVGDGVLYFVQNNENEWLYNSYSLSNNYSGEGVLSWLREEKKKGKSYYLNYSMDGKVILLNMVEQAFSKRKLYYGDSSNLAQIKELNTGKRQLSIGRATISPDGKILVFSASLKKNKENIDLWLCRLKGKTWSEPENIGNLINTKKDEVMPCFISDNRLCFSSNGLGGSGGFDLFYSDWDGTRFSTPVNMGKGVNSANNEVGACLDLLSGVFYFASDRRGNYDVYKYEKKKEILLSDENLPLIADSGMDSYTVIPTKEEEVDLSTKEEETLSEETEATYLEPEEEQEFTIDLSTPILSNNHTFSAKKNDKITERPTSGFFYSVQITALSGPVERLTLKKMSTKLIDPFLVKEGKWLKLRAGYFKTYTMAQNYAKTLGDMPYYIVRMSYSDEIDVLDQK